MMGTDVWNLISTECHFGRLQTCYLQPDRDTDSACPAERHAINMAEYVIWGKRWRYSLFPVELCAIRNNTAVEFALNRCIERLRDELRAQALPGQANRVDLSSDLVL